jgi:protein-S-isoprenylcysteine O-methyltransferase Ste14
MQEARAKKKWKDNEEYNDYLQNTPMLIPRLKLR